MHPHFLAQIKLSQLQLLNLLLQFQKPLLHLQTLRAPRRRRTLAGAVASRRRGGPLASISMRGVSVAAASSWLHPVHRGPLAAASRLHPGGELAGSIAQLAARVHRSFGPSHAPRQCSSDAE